MVCIILMFRHFREKRLLASSCPSVRMEQLGFHWTDFDETWYLRRFRKSVEKIQMSLQSDKNGYFNEDVRNF
jgi:hypothetical protein